MTDTVLPTPPTLPQPLVLFMPTLAVYVLSIYASVLAASCFLDDTTLRNLLAGGAMTMAGQIVQFYYGSSKGSQDKDASMIHTAAVAATPPTTTATVTAATATVPASASITSEAAKPPDVSPVPPKPET